MNFLLMMILIGSLGTTSSTKPNIVILLADDLGYGDLGYTGHPTISSPNIDRLSRRGKILTQFYSAASICSPSRAALLTGRYPVRSGIFPGNFGPQSIDGLPDDEMTIAKELSLNGYETAMVGKWHLGVGSDGRHLPVHKGFRSWLGIPFSHDMCPFRMPCNPDSFCIGKSGSSPGDTYCALYNGSKIIQQPLKMVTLTKSMTDFAKDFIEISSKKQKPFFLFYSFPQPHHPQFAGSDFHNTSRNGAYGDAIAEMDAAVGDLIKHLRAQNVLNNTIVWFTSDNGPRKGTAGTLQLGSSGTFRGGKGEIFEGGFRVPSVVWWKDKISGGKQTPSLFSSLDIYKTLLSMVGFETKFGDDGLDLSAQVLDTATKKAKRAKVRENFLYFFRGEPFGQASAMRHKEYKLITQVGTKVLEKPMLFNVELDPGESVDLFGRAEFQPITQKMIKLKKALEKEVRWRESVTQRNSPKVMPCCKNSCMETKYVNTKVCCVC